MAYLGFGERGLGRAERAEGESEMKKRNIECGECNT